MAHSTVHSSLALASSFNKATLDQVMDVQHLCDITLTNYRCKELIFNKFYSKVTGVRTCNICLRGYSPTHRGDKLCRASLINFQTHSSLRFQVLWLQWAHIPSAFQTSPLLPGPLKVEGQGLHSKHLFHSESPLLEVIHAFIFSISDCPFSLTLTSLLGPRPKCPTVYLK